MGLNNARNRVQTCLRLAIDAGFGLVLPSATLRNDPEHLKVLNGTAVSLDEYWDTEYLRGTMQKVCPQLEIRKSDDRSGIANVIEARRRAYETELWHYGVGTFRERMMEAFEESPDISFETVNPANATVVSWADPFLAWDYHRASETMTIKKALFKIIKYNQKLLGISRQMLRNPQLSDRNFIGVHLRGEKDWPDLAGSRDLQIELYAKGIERLQKEDPSQFKTVYVSCGDPEAIESFRARLAPLGLTTVDKWTLFAEQSDVMGEVNGLAFDQKAIVE